MRHTKDVGLDNCATCVCNMPGANNEYLRLNDATRGSDPDAEMSWGKCCPGWNGTACDVCMDVAACPERNGVPAVNCSAGMVEPRARRADVSPTNRGDAAAATQMFLR